MGSELKREIFCGGGKAPGSMKIYVLIPALNESKTIGQLVHQLLAHAQRVIVVDDGSTDDTPERAEDAGAIVIRHGKNRGKGAALRTGFGYAVKTDCDGVITMDGDGQHDWKEVPLFVNKAESSDADIVLGTRMGCIKGMPLIRLLTNIVTSLIVSVLSRQKITDSQTGYRLIRREVLQNVELLTANYETESEILIKASRKGYKITEIPIKTIYGQESSNINRLTDTFRFIVLVLKTAMPFGHG